MKTEKRYTKITRKRLKECLELIGWSIKRHGNNNYYIYNNHKRATNFKFYSEDENNVIYEISFCGDFGGGHINTTGGDCVFVTERCILNVFVGNNKYDCVSIGAMESPKKVKAYLQFYNHESNSQSHAVK